MPEGDTIFRASRTLNRALVGQAITKWMLMHLSGDRILLTYMLMSGSWHIYRPGEKWRLPRSSMRVMIATERKETVTFSIQIAEFHTQESLKRRAGFAALGTPLLARGFNADQGVQRGYGLSGLNCATTRRTTGLR